MYKAINNNEYLTAMRESVSDSTHIKALVKPALTTKIDDREMFMKGIDYSYYYEQNEWYIRWGKILSITLSLFFYTYKLTQSNIFYGFNRTRESTTF